MPEAMRPKRDVPQVPVVKSQLERWKATGVVALSECNLKHLPAMINSLSSLHVSRADSFTIATLPRVISTLTSLRQLHIAHNYLTGLPSEIGQLTSLEVLKVNNNRIHSIPENIGGCASLVEVDLSSNLLVELPETISKLKDLKALYLRNNGSKSLPSIIFKQCCELSILDLHGTEITMDVICQSQSQIEGWENFNERRCSKHQKQLDFGVSSSGKFDEGANRS
ncbi:hypothetical protein BC332_14887 [Capsicum chinense]|nr:hypothetical protein BC332_14887 [Capsicum chinense]